MSVSYVASITSTSGFTSAGSNLTLPTGSATGDTIIVSYVYYGNSSSGNTVGVSNSAGSMSVLTTETAYGYSGRRFFGVRYATLTSTDISNGYIYVHASDYYSYAGVFILITMRDLTSTSLLNQNKAATDGSSPLSFSNSVTPVSASQLLLFMVFSDVNVTASTYAIATSNPTWTEIIDSTRDGGGGNYVSYHVAYSDTRSSSSATGTSNVTLSSSATSVYGVMISLANPVDATVLLDTAGTLTLSHGGTHAILLDYTTNVVVGTLTMSGNEVTLDTTENAIYSGDSKPTTNWTSLSK